MNSKEIEILNRWKGRALRAENKLRLAGMPGGEAVAAFDDDEFLVLCMVHKDGSTCTIDDITAAEQRIAERARLSVENGSR